MTSGGDDHGVLNYHRATNHSAESVRHKIRQLIEAEQSGAEVHSDDAIVEILKEAGVDIARRTVAKYREAIGLGSAVQRRRQKALAGVR